MTALSAQDFVTTDEQKRVMLDTEWDLVSVDQVPADNPVLTYVSAQSAAGKSHMVSRLQLTRPGVVVDSDEIRLLHPCLDDIVAADEIRMDVLSNEVSSSPAFSTGAAHTGLTSIWKTRSLTQKLLNAPSATSPTPATPSSWSSLPLPVRSVVLASLNATLLNNSLRSPRPGGRACPGMIVATALSPRRSFP